jgi:hypothetical protein
MCQCASDSIVNDTTEFCVYLCFLPTTMTLFLRLTMWYSWNYKLWHLTLRIFFVVIYIFWFTGVHRWGRLFFLFIPFANGQLIVNRLRKIAWASVWLFLFEMAAYTYIDIDIKILYIYVYREIYIYAAVSIYIYIYIRKTELTENGNFQVFSANGKWKMEVCFPWLAKG